MITRKAKLDPTVQSKVNKVLAQHFDYGDGSLEKRAEVLAKNLISISVNLKPIEVAKAKPAPKKAAPKQTKKPSEEKKKETPKKKKSGVQPKAKAKKVSPNKVKPKAKRGGRGGGSASKTGKAEVKKEPIQVRWAKMSPSAKSSYIQNRAGKSIKTADADEALSKIWSKLSLAQQQSHMRRHPGSRLKVAKLAAKKAGAPRSKKPAGDGPTTEVATTTTTAGPEDHRDVSWWNEQSAKDQQKYIRMYPESKFALHHQGIVHNLVRKAGEAIKDSAKKTGSDFHQGMAGLKAFRQGAKMTDEQKKGLKSTAIKVGAVLALALVGLAVFTPLGPVAMDFGEAWFKEHPWKSGDNKAEAGVNLEGHEAADAHTAAQHKSNDEQLAWMVKDMTKFALSIKDPAAFAKKISKADKT